LYQVQKCSNLIMLIVSIDYDVVNVLVTLLEAFLNIFGGHTHTQTQRHCFTPAVHARAG